MGGFLSSIFSSRNTTTTATTSPVATNSPRIIPETQQQGSSPAAEASPNQGTISKRACFGAGCYWGTENFFRHQFSGSKYIRDGNVGFMGPATAKKNPSYREVCEGTTGHVEVFDFTFDGPNPEEIYRDAVRFLFMMHDPTTPDRQGNDRGTQYASVIYCYDDEQVNIAKRVRTELQGHINNGKVTGYRNKKVCTDIRKSTIFYPAHEEHQKYLENNPRGYCNHSIRFEKWPEY